MYQRVFFGQVKHEVNNTIPDLNLREKTALWPAVVLALGMGVAPMLWLNAIDSAVHNVLVPIADKGVGATQPVKSPGLPQLASKVGGQ
jgi:NADH-quinone oxidoreductase subunit M